MPEPVTSGGRLRPLRARDLRQIRDPFLVGLALAGESEQGFEEGLGVQCRAKCNANLSLGRCDVAPAMRDPSGDGELIAHVKVALATLDAHPQRAGHHSELLDLVYVPVLCSD